ncbi:MAG: helix-turn-helix domain-containing protein [Thermoanaerobaculia bacterium]|nr:helix-turn-helix domain-containing protein [Thermoanaerobaculia bacterium]
MSDPSARLRFILGLKLKQLRSEHGWTLKEAASRAGLSFSYLSEIEKGKKYPTPSKLLELAETYGVPFDDLVSLRLSDDLAPIQEILGSDLLREFPLEMFGLRREDLLSLATDAPDKAGALVGALLDVGRTYDLQVEHFLLAALRSYQQTHRNYFADLEAAALDLRKTLGWGLEEPLDLPMLRRHLEEQFGLAIDTDALSEDPDLSGFRSVFLAGPPARLLVNGRLLASQQRFVLARELGYRVLNLPEYAPTSSWLRIESFEQLLSNFRASYFAGALLMPEEPARLGIQRLFDAATWEPARVRDLRREFDVTPEMLAYRLTQLAPRHLGLEELFFLRFARRRTTGSYRLTKVFNLSRVPVPHGLGRHEHYCRRWPAMRLLGQEATAASADVTLQRSHFVTEDAEFLILTQSRPLALSDDAESAVSVGFLVDRSLRSRVKYLEDASIPRFEVGLTCERCPLSESDCSERVAEPTLLRARLLRERQEQALIRLGVV